MTVNIKSASIDQTPLFKAMTKIKATKQGKVVSVPSPSSTPVFSLLTRQLGEIAAELVDLMKLVLTKRADYLAFNTFHPVMTDGQRDRFDNDTLKALTGLKIVVNTTQERIKMEQMRDEEKDHLKAVAEGLERRIKHIVDICGQMRTARLVHLARRKRDFKLAHLVQEKKAKEMNSRLSPVNSFNSLLAFEKQGEQEVRRRKIDTEDWEGFENSRDGKKDNETVFEEMERREREEREREERRKVLTVEEMEHTTSTVLPEAGDAERVQLMEENERTYDRLANVHKEMDGVEMQVAEIQRLQETFAEKLMEQEQDIEILHEQAQNTTENLREANDFIREAITNSASRRVVILFCIVVLTFAILWVDWYNP